MAEQTAQMCRYEGLTKLEQPHGRGVFILGRGGKGAGLRNAKMGDKYEGDFYYGLAHGVGMRTGASGRVYRGEWLDGAPDGCGVEYNLGPWLKAVKKGRRPDLAFKDVRREVVGKMRVGMWRHGIYVADAVEDSPSLCTFSEIRSLMNETTDVVTKARQFVHKPGGDVRRALSLLSLLSAHAGSDVLSCASVVTIAHAALVLCQMHGKKKEINLRVVLGNRAASPVPCCPWQHSMHACSKEVRLSDV